MARFSRLRFSLGILVFLTLLSGILLTNSYTHALDDEDAISCTLSYSVDSEHTVTATNNSYTTDIGTTTFSAVCNDNAGFAIYTVGYSNNEYGNNKMLANVNNTLDPTYDIATGTATSGDTSNWAMKLSAVSGDYTPTIENNFNNYSSIPNEYTKAVSFPSTTDDTVGSKLRSTYAIYLSTTQPAGTYTGEVKYTLVHPQTETPCMEGKICYHKNANNVVGSMGRQNATGTTAMLMASNFSHDGYGFAGWNTEEDGTGTSYGPNETITLPSDMSEGLNLYAMWVKSTGSLQDWGGCYEMNIGDVTALTDQRDNDTYAIARLADGNCWMIENLRLDNDATTGSANEALAQGYGTSTTYGNFSGLANPEAPWIGDNTTANSLYRIDGSDGTINIGADNDPARRFPRYNNQNTASRDSYPTTNQNIYSYGNYYTWAAAIADLKPNDTNNQITTGTSLCPTGWRLPSGGAAYASDSTTGVNVTGDTSTYRDFYNLGYKIMDEVKTAYEDTAGSDGAYYSDNTTNLVGDTATKAFRKYPNNFVLSGYVYNGSISNRNSYGLYWSSTARNTDYAYRLYMNNSVVYPSTAGGNKYYGRSVRCITASTARQNVTINFDERVKSVILHSDEFGTKTVTRSGSVVELPENTTYTISGTYDTDYDFESWSTTANGTLGSTSSAETTYAVSGAATLTLYSKKVCSQGNICYDKNNRDANAPGGDMGNQTVSGTSAILWASNYGREGYGFAGWNTAADGTGTSYGPNETITFDPNDPDGLMLYAMWVESEGDLQDFVCPDNTQMPIGTVTGLTDTRDGQTYAVAKLADGNCWMVENLRLGRTDSDNNIVTLSASNTNNPLLPLTNNDGNTSNSLSASQDPAVSAWCSDNDAICDDKSMVFTGNTINPVANMTDGDQNIYTYGNYYNWYSATAGNGKYSTTSYATTDGDICPSNWFLPYGNDGTGNKGGNTNGGYYYLGVKLNAIDSSTASSEIWRSYPNNFILSGNADASSITSRFHGGMYWTATTLGNNTAHSFSFGSDVLNPGTGNNRKNIGRAVRCVIKAIPSKSVTVNFDDGVDKVILQNSRYGDITVDTSGTTVQIKENIEYTISATYKTEKDFDGWTTTANGTLGSASSAETTYKVSGTATLSLITKNVCIQGRICYDNNHNDTNASGGSMGKQSVSGSTTTLWASNFKREGYGFAGWNTEADGTGTNYGPNETIQTSDFATTNPKGLRLYAKWVAPAQDANSTELTFQTANLLTTTLKDGTTLASKPNGYVTALKDQRDGDVYAVAKLADGNYWMIENLRLADKDSDNNDIVLSSSNTHNPSLPLTNTDSTTSNHLSATTNPTQNPWCTGSSSDCIDKSMLATNNTTLFTNNTASGYSAGGNVYSYGNYYNWYSATAGHGKFGSNYGSSFVAPGDICPAGWHLPTGRGATGDFGVLDIALGGTGGYSGPNTTPAGATISLAYRSYPNNFVYTGYVYGSGIGSSRNIDGGYWSASGNWNDTSNYFSFSNSSVYPGTTTSVKFVGHMVRCIYGVQ